MKNSVYSIVRGSRRMCFLTGRSLLHLSLVWQPLVQIIKVQHLILFF
jgi:hypothetical protein